MTFDLEMIEYAAKHDEHVGRCIPIYRVHVLGKWETIMEWCKLNFENHSWCWNHARGIDEFELGFKKESDWMLAKLAWPEW